MKLIVTVDTEEDNWARYSTTENPVENIERISSLQTLFDQYGVTPTYLVSYPVATNPKSVKILRRILDEGKCEIGMHCHPWNTPPFDEDEAIVERETMLCNLSEELQYEKLAFLHMAICKNFGEVPVSFRAGRWGFGAAVGRALCKLGYRVDTSVTPFVSWKNYQGPDFYDFGPGPFSFTPQGFLQNNTKEALLELPVTIGFLQPNFQLCRRLIKIIEKPVARKLHLVGILYRLRLLNKIWLSPELSDASTMIRLAMRMQKKKYPFLNMNFHSNSLMRGMGPFVRTKLEEHRFLKEIKEFLMYACTAGWEFQTLAQAGISVRG